MKRWLAEHVWLIFWVVCLSQAVLWAWWISFAVKNRPQAIEPGRPAAGQMVDSTEQQSPSDEEVAP